MVDEYRQHGDDMAPSPQDMAVAVWSLDPSSGHIASNSYVKVIDLSKLEEVTAVEDFWVDKAGEGCLEPGF